MRFLHRQSEHHFCCQVDEVDLQYLADKRERARGAQVAFNHEDVVLARHKLNVERTADVQLLGNLPADALDSAHGLHVELLWRKLNGGIAGMHTCKLDVL